MKALCGLRRFLEEWYLTLHMILDVYEFVHLKEVAMLYISDSEKAFVVNVLAHVVDHLSLRSSKLCLDFVAKQIKRVLEVCLHWNAKLIFELPIQDSSDLFMLHNGPSIRSLLQTFWIESFHSGKTLLAERRNVENAEPETHSNPALWRQLVDPFFKPTNTVLPDIAIGAASLSVFMHHPMQSAWKAKNIVKGSYVRR